MGDANADPLLLTSVLEHLEEPTAASQGIRLLKRAALLRLPLFICDPRARGRFRYSPFGLRPSLEEAGSSVEVRRSPGVDNVLRELSYALRRLPKGLGAPLRDSVRRVAQLAGGRLELLTSSRGLHDHSRSRAPES